MNMAIFRLDKYLAEVGIGSRSDVKNIIKAGKIKVDGVCVKKADTKINTDTAIVTYNDNPLVYEKYVYFMLNKPKGVVSATEDKVDKTVIDIITEAKHMNLFPVGRLDKDTEGLLIITNDGELAHNLLSPKKHVCKKYYVELDEEVTEEKASKLTNGIELDDFVTMPAQIDHTDDNKKVYITIMEGKFHQVKRMFKAVGCNVLYLKRVSMGKLKLDEKLKQGEYRRLTNDELALLKENQNDN